MTESLHGDAQCMLCGRLVAEWHVGRLELNPTYPGDPLMALRGARCTVCGGPVLLSSKPPAGMTPVAMWRPRPR
jgi:DNA-directed RNA polymerase subunit RPC12/RpoP